jgi:hypothetical protein
MKIQDRQTPQEIISFVRQTPNKLLDQSETIRSTIINNDLLKTFRTIEDSLEGLNEKVNKVEKTLQEKTAMIQPKIRELQNQRAYRNNQQIDNQNLAKDLVTALHAFKNKIQITSSTGERNDVLKIEFAVTKSAESPVLKKFIKATKERIFQITDLVKAIFEILFGPQRKAESITLFEKLKEFCASMDSIQKDSEYPLEGVLIKVEDLFAQTISELKPR